jgi:hypothetical protein
VQFIVPLRDRYAGPALSPVLERWLGAYRRIEIDAGHWLVLRELERIAARIERFVAGHREGCSNGQRTRGRRVNKVG